MMEIFDNPAQMQEWSNDHRSQHKSIGLVPTMGALHDGHASLISRSCDQNDLSIVSIYINPLQFSPDEDFDSYPKTWQADKDLCQALGVDAIFLPTDASMYPAGFDTVISNKTLGTGLCGASRPGHFDGVTTVVAKLFNCTLASRAYFGEKDFQQLRIIHRMVEDLNVQIEIVDCPIYRESDGLAMSSRNQHLSQDARQAATTLFSSLCFARDLLIGGMTDIEQLKAMVRDRVNANELCQLDYFTIVSADNLLDQFELTDKLCIALAVHVGGVRLIDNIIFNM